MKSFFLFHFKILGMQINEIPEIDENDDENPLFIIVNNAPVHLQLFQN